MPSERMAPTRKIFGRRLQAAFDWYNANPTHPYKLTWTYVATEAHISYRTMMRMLNQQDFDPRLDYVNWLAKVLEIDPEYLCPWFAESALPWVRQAQAERARENGARAAEG
jgi:hypothetical protein